MPEAVDDDPEDVLAKALAGIIVDLKREWRMELEVITAESRATVAELKTQIADGMVKYAEIKGQYDALAVQLETQVCEAVSQIRDGVDGKDGAPGRNGENGRDGLSPNPADIDQMVVLHVAAAIDALPPATDGQPGKDGINGKDGQSVSPMELRSLIDIAVEERVAKIEVTHGVDGKDGHPGKDGQDGKNVDHDVVRAMVVEEVAKIPAPQDGKDGENGTAGKDGVPGKDGVDGKSVALEEVRGIVDAAVIEKVSQIVVKDGKDGTPGKDGKDGVGAAGAFIDRDGQLVLTLSDGQVKHLGKVQGDPGKDGFSAEDLTFDTDGERVIILRYERAGVRKEARLVIPGMIYRGVWQEREFVKGDAITWGGSLWIAMRDTADKPESSDAWRLATKKGRDGKDGGGPPPKPNHPPIKLK